MRCVNKEICEAKAPIANGTIGWLPDFFLLSVRGGARWAGGGVYVAVAMPMAAAYSTAVNFPISK